MEKASGKIRLALALEYPLRQQGGMEVLVRLLARRLADRFEIILVSGDRDLEELREQVGPMVTGHLSWDNRKACRGSAKKLAAQLVGLGVKLVHFHGSMYEWQSHKAWQSPIYHVTAAGIPCLFTNHLMPPLLVGYSDSSRPDWQKMLLLPKAWLSKALLLHREQVEVLVSRHDYARLRRQFPLQAAKLSQIYHSRLEREEEGLPLHQRQKTLLCLGTFCERKGQIVLTRAFISVADRHPGWNLHLMGQIADPEYFAELSKIVAESGMQDRILISPPQDDPRPFLAAASIFVMPSLFESLGLSLQEALYYECACVGSSVGGIPELIDHEKTGLLVPPGDEKALSHAIDRLISDSELRRHLTQRARQSIIEKGMLAEIMTKKYIELYESILLRARMATPI